MTKWKPCKRRDFIRRLKKLGFNGPFPGGNHKHMTYGRCFIPIPKESEYSVSKLREIIVEVEDIIGRKIIFRLNIVHTYLKRRYSQKL